MKLAKDDVKAIEDSHTKIDEAKGTLEQIRDEYQDKFDNMSAKVQEGEKGQELQTFLERFEEIIDSLDSALDSINSSYEG